MPAFRGGYRAGAGGRGALEGGSARRGSARPYSHSIVAGGLLLTS